jgi:hypothetical protein
LLERLHQQNVVDAWLQVSHVNLVAFNHLGLVRVHLLIRILSCCRAGCSSRHASPVRCPVELEVLV